MLVSKEAFDAEREEYIGRVCPLLQPHSPAFSVLPPEIAFRLRAIGKLHVRGVPRQLAPDAVGDVPQEYRFRDRAGVVEIAARGDSGLAGGDPLAMMPRG